MPILHGRSAAGLLCLFAIACDTRPELEGSRLQLPGVTPSGAGAGSGGGSGGGGAEEPSFVRSPDASVGMPVERDGGIADPVCGDGVVDANEECDDGNIAGDDGCSALCIKAPDYACTEGQLCVSTVVCGDRRLSTGEGCDDGNTTAGDGCDAACQIEAGWICPILGIRCSAAACGDGIVAGLEQCDDGNPDPDDGCSDACGVEPGFACDLDLAQSPQSACHETTCNDGLREGSEPCDDGNAVAGDGCTPFCEVEPSCPKMGGACSSSCGDGLILPADDEECDDGNTIDGDGCSATCQVEAGYMCELVESDLPESIDVLFTYRDFVAIPEVGTPVSRHPDFNGRCGDHVEGIVQDGLDAEGKPVNSGLCDLAVACDVEFEYVDADPWGCFDVNGDNCPDPADAPCGGTATHANHPIPGTTVDPFYYWYRDDAAVNVTKVVSETLTLNADGIYQFSDNALFPFDGEGWVAAGMELPAPGDGDTDHNFGFTTEVRRWFQFQGGELLNFDGDDDVWVFINGRLALDIGGIHRDLDRTIWLNTDGTVSCKEGIAADTTEFDALDDCDTPSRDVGIEVGSVYEIVLFHAERHTTESNFTLGLGGFVSAKTECRPVCGDGVVTLDEQCDEGDDNGAVDYGGCEEDCTLGPYCGDGVVNGGEDCDDGPANTSTYGSTGCAPGCLAPPRCGDGILQPGREECDLGDDENVGGYDGCRSNCRLGPYCGDGVKDSPEEECDDGNRRRGDGCDGSCKDEDIR